MAAAQENYPLEYTPTWTVAVVCSVFVIVSLGLQRGIHRLKKNLQKRSQKALCESLEKLKEELMLLGFISLLLTVFQGPINHICIPKRYTRYMLPCRRTEAKNAIAEGLGLESESHARKLFSLLGSTRRVLSEGTDAGHCQKKGKAPFLSTEGLHHLHIFIFVLAIVHVVYGGLTMLLGIAKIRTWKRWEDEIRENKYNTKDGLKRRFTYGARDDFVKSYSEGPTRESIVQSWMVSLCKQFYGSVTKSDYGTLRGGFIQTHCKSNRSFDFHKYMMRTLEADFKKVVGISGYLWVFVVIFLLLNINGWHTYFWIAFIPLILLLAVGAKLEHVIIQLVQDVAKKHTSEGEIVVRPSDEHFWFGRPRLVLYLIHFILFQNAFEIAFFFWILTIYGIDSCIMDGLFYIIPRLLIGIVVQVFCSYSTLPLYALVTQMGSMFKESIFDEHIQQGIIGWCTKAKIKAKAKGNTKTEGDSNGGMHMFNTNGTYQMQTAIVHNAETSSDLEAKIVAVDIIPNSVLPSR